MISLFETISRLYSTSTSSDLISEASNGGDSSNNSNSNSIINESRSFIRRAWDKVETIFIQRQEETTILPTYLEHLQESDDGQDEEFIHPNPYHEHNRDLIYRRNLRKRRLSQHSQELISAIPEEEDPSPSVDWNSISDLQQYDGWRNDLLDIEQSQEGNVKNMVAGWAMGEASPWFD